MRLPDDLFMDSDNLDDLCDFVYNRLDENFKNLTLLCSHAIIYPTNSTVDKVNSEILRGFLEMLDSTKVETKSPGKSVHARIHKHASSTIGIPTP